MLGSLGLGAQSLEFGLFAGLATYSGDLTPNPWSIKPQAVHPAGALVARWHANDQIVLRMSVMQTTVSGDDAYYDNPRGLRFRSDLTEVALVAEYQPFRIKIGRSALIPFAYGGAAVFRFNPETTYENFRVDLQPLGTEGQGMAGYDEPYDLQQLALPFGAGIKLAINEAWVLSVDYGGRKLFTDYLDDVGSQTVRYGDLFVDRNEIRPVLSNPKFDPDTDDFDRSYRRGGPGHDWFSTFGLTLSYRLGADAGFRKGRTACYKW